MSTQVEAILLKHWHEEVQGRFLYRGMSRKDVTDPLDPTFDPFAPIRESLFRLMGILQKLLDAGFEFAVHEDYSGYSFPLQHILDWTRNDLGPRGIDFTPKHEDASGYAQNFQGSQLKQNFRFITDRLPDSADQQLVRRTMTAADWGVVSEVGEWVSRVTEAPANVCVRLCRPLRAVDIAKIERVGRHETCDIGFSDNIARIQP